MYLVMFGVVEVVLSQLPSLEKVTFVSIVAAVMSFTYSFIAFFLSVRPARKDRPVAVYSHLHRSAAKRRSGGW